jgi:hypothetical protein
MVLLGDVGQVEARFGPFRNIIHSEITLGRNELSLDPRHLGVPSDVPKMSSKHVVRLAQTVHLSCVEANTILKWR